MKREINFCLVNTDTIVQALLFFKVTVLLGKKVCLEVAKHNPKETDLCPTRKHWGRNLGQKLMMWSGLAQKLISEYFTSSSTPAPLAHAQWRNVMWSLTPFVWVLKHVTSWTLGATKGEYYLYKYWSVKLSRHHCNGPLDSNGDHLGTKVCWFHIP